MFMVSVGGHAPPFGAQPHTSMWLCPTIISDLRDLQYHYSGFEMDMISGSQKYESTWWCFVKSQKILYFVCLMSYFQHF